MIRSSALPYRQFILATLLICAGFARAGANPDPRYYRYDQIIERFQTWQQQYPDIFQMEILGETGVEHEPIWAARISDNAAVHEPEPVLFFHGAQHANEPNGTNAILYMMERLLSRYGQDPYETGLVNGLQMWFVPIVNVDGHRMAFGDTPNAMNWRKTKRDNDGDGEYTWPTDGVDLNRNWDWRWALDPATQPDDEYYKGPFPFSEPEVVGLRDFILRYRPLVVMDYHSPYSDSMGDMVFWSWMDTAGGLPAPDSNYQSSVAHALMNRTLTEVNGQHYGGLAGFNTLPKEQNWVYGRTQICILLMEITHDNFWTGAMVDTIAARVGRGSFALMDRSLTGPGITGRVTDAITGEALDAEIRVQQAYHPAIGPFMSEKQLGTYWRFLSSGSYTVTARAADHFDQTRTIGVTSGWTVLDFELEPDLSAVAGGAEPPALLWSENPLRRGGTVHLRGPAGRDASLRVFDNGGRLVRHLPLGRAEEAAWDGRGDDGAPLPAGIYYIRAAEGGSALKVVLRAN